MLKKKNQKLLNRPDFLHGSYWMVKFVNKFMKNGKKNVIEKWVFLAFAQIKKEIHLRTLYLFINIVLKFRPLLGFISKRFGKQFKKIPVPLYPRRQMIISLKWLVTAIKVNPSLSLKTRIIAEFLDYHKGKKTALTKRYQDHLIEINENRLNHRFRWK